MNWTPIRLMASGIVAEKRRVWRSSGTRLIIASMSSRKPMLSISSASSKIKVSILLSLRALRLIRSRRRPGVPTTMWAPERRALICFSMLEPPYTERTLTPLSRPKRKSSSWDCTANSRVGAITRAWIVFSSVRILSRVGKPKAAVLPVPVCAWPMTSLPSRASGIVNSWIGDGCSKPAATTADWMSSDRFKSVNFKVFFFLLKVVRSYLMRLGWADKASACILQSLI